MNEGSGHGFVGVCVDMLAPRGFVWDASGCGHQIPLKRCDRGGFGGDNNRWHCQWPVRHSVYVSAIGVLVSLGLCWRNFRCHEKLWMLLRLTSSVICFFHPSPQWWISNNNVYAASIMFLQMYNRPNCPCFCHHHQHHQYHFIIITTSNINININIMVMMWYFYEWLFFVFVSGFIFKCSAEFCTVE